MISANQIAAVAAYCRSKCPIGWSLKAIHKIAKERLGVKRLSAKCAKPIQLEIERQHDLARRRNLSRPADPKSPMHVRWPNERSGWITRHVLSVVRNGFVYHTNQSGEGTHSISADIGPELSAETERTFTEWKKYGRRGYYPAYFDWQTKISVAPGWLTKIKNIGTTNVEGHLVMDVGDRLDASDGAEAYRAHLLFQGRGTTLKIEERAIHRVPGGEWRISQIPKLSRWDRIAEVPRKVRKPVRRKDQDQHVA